jgi:hypothetical protein
MRRFRIKEWESFIVQNDEIYLEAFLANIQYYGFAEVSFFDKTSGESQRFFKLVPWTGLWRFPQSLYNSSFESRSLGFQFRVHTWLDADIIEADLDLEPAIDRPPFTAHLEFDLDRRQTTPLVVNLLFDENRSLYTYKALGGVRGDIVYKQRRYSLESGKTGGLFRDCKGFFPYRLRSVWCSAFAHGEKGLYGFSLAENQANEANRDNENAFWLAGRLTALPPIRITTPDGIDGQWVIQDIEGMVDLVFTPKGTASSSFDLLLTKASYYTPVGVYNGMVMTKDGEKVAIRDLWGMGEKLYLRV